MIKYICDRCESIVAGPDKLYTVSPLTSKKSSPPAWAGNGGDLCEGCLKAFQQWLKSKPFDVPGGRK